MLVKNTLAQAMELAKSSPFINTEVHKLKEKYDSKDIIYKQCLDQALKVKQQIAELEGA